MTPVATYQEQANRCADGAARAAREGWRELAMMMLEEREFWLSLARHSVSFERDVEAFRAAEEVSASGATLH